MNTETLAEELHRLFLLKDFQWKIDGVLQPPSVQDIQDTLDRVKTRLYSEPNGTQLEVGHLICQKTDSGLDVYLHLGEMNDENG